MNEICYNNKYLFIYAGTVVAGVVGKFNIFLKLMMK